LEKKKTNVLTKPVTLIMSCLSLIRTYYFNFRSFGGKMWLYWVGRCMLPVMFYL